jgi:hypothetical protein
MKASEMTVEKFDEILPQLQFSLLQYPARMAYEGAGPRCLIAHYDGLDVLFESGSYEIYGNDEDDNVFNYWCVSIDNEFNTAIRLA